MSVEVLKQIWPEWSIEKRIGGGAYGTVYEASRNEYGVENHAAIKIISIPASEAEIDTLRSEGLDMQATKTHFQTIVNDFVNEIRLMVSLEGRPNIVNVKDYKVVEKKGEFGWHIFILMELLTPFAVYTCDHQMTEDEVIKLGCDICTALETCAEEKIIHRDIKPGNILVHKSGDFKLGDFGIARKLENMTGGLSQRYTPKYMAPEVATSMYYDERVDIYSLGIVLYELLNGRRIPFQPNKQINSLADIETAVRRRNSGEAFDGPSNASPAMADLILRACAYDPNMRFASATEMKQALMSVANGTYEMSEIGKKDRIITDRRAPAEYDKTTTVRKAPAASNQKSAPAVSTFGSAPKKKNKMPAVIATVLVVVLLVGAGIFIIPNLIDNNGSINSGETSGNNSSETNGTPSETVDYSKFDEEQIANIISEAEALAVEDDYEGALVKVQTGLVTYPKSAELQDKADEYAEALNAQIKAKTLDEAKTLADSGDYVSAIALIKNAQEAQGDDSDYQAALKTYSTAYKTEAISSADGLAANGDYLGAIAKISEAKAILGEDTELSNKSKAYEDEYVSSVITEADMLISNGESDSALELLNSAEKVVPNNTYIQAKIESLTPHCMTDTVPAYQSGGNPYKEYSSVKSGNSEHFSMAGVKYYNGMTFSADYNIFDDISWAVYNLGKKYSRMEFTVCHVDGTDLGDKNTLQIIYDGVVKEEIELTPDMAPKFISLDISGVNQLKLQIGASGGDHPLYGLGNPVVFSAGVPEPESDENNTTIRYMTDILPAYQSGGNPYKEYSSVKSGNSEHFSMAGVKYYNGMTFSADYNIFDEVSWAVYSLNKSYSKLTFTLCHVDGTDLGDKNILQVIYDGVVKEEIELAPDMAPKSISLDVSGVTQLKFQIGASGGDHPLYGIGNPILE